MIELKVREVAQAARARYEAGTLSAQAPKPVCMYRSEQDGVTYACGIGAALTDSDLIALAKASENARFEGDIQGTVMGSLEGWDADDPRAISDLQRRHDDWANVAAGRDSMPGGESEASRRFLATLDSYLAPETPHASDPAAQVRETEETEREAADDSAND